MVVKGGGGEYIDRRAIFKQELTILAIIFLIVNLTTLFKGHYLFIIKLLKCNRIYTKYLYKYLNSL